MELIKNLENICDRTLFEYKYDIDASRVVSFRSTQGQKGVNIPLAKSGTWKVTHADAPFLYYAMTTLEMEQVKKCKQKNVNGKMKIILIIINNNNQYINIEN